MRKAIDIVNKDYVTVDALWGMMQVQEIAKDTKTDCFPVIKDGKIIGVLTKTDLIISHPNRIVLDTMSGSFKYIEAEESVWKAKELFEEEKIEILLVCQDEKIIGVITKNDICLEINKHIDLMTGLYKKDYIIYKSLKLLKEGKEIYIIFFDVNNFGYIDKKFGHVVGDSILKEISQILKDNTPEGGFLCRYGGDEFVLLLDKCADDCKTLTREIINKINQHEFYKDINISISAGIAGGKRQSADKENLYKTVVNLINAASLASTKAKNEKGNLTLGHIGIIDAQASMI